MTVIIGQNENLPNIKGSLNIPGNDLIGSSGVFSDGIASVSYNVLSPSTLKQQLRYVNFNAKASNEIYKDDAHVTPNNVTIKIWRRTA